METLHLRIKHILSTQNEVRYLSLIFNDKNLITFSDYTTDFLQSCIIGSAGH